MGDDNPQELGTQIWRWLTNARLIRFILLFALAWALVQALAFFQSVIIIFTFAAILAFLLSYPVRWVQRYLPRSWAVLVVFLLALLLFSSFVFTIGVTILAQGQQLLEQAPTWADASTALLDQVQQWFANANFNVDLSNLEEYLQDQAIASFGFGLGVLQRVLLSMVDLILIAVIGFFMLLDGDRLWNFLIQGVPFTYRERVNDAIRQNLLGFFWGRFLLSVFFGLSCLVTFLILPVPYALLLATIGGIFDLIPGIGATLGVTLIAVILLPQGLWLSITVIVVCILLQQVEENLLMPHIMQGSINMNPVVMFFALLMGLQVAGLLGLFLAIPLAGVMISLFGIDAMKGNKRS
jgi:predicted PurR-regulated permease PerM